MGDLEKEEGLLKRFRDLEASQEKLREQLELVLREGSGVELESDNYDPRNHRNMNRNNNRERDRQNRQHDVVIIPGYFSQSPYQSVLQHIGRAVHVYRPATGEIVYW